MVADVTNITGRGACPAKHRMTIGGYVSPVQCRNSYTLSTSYIVHVILYRCMYIVLDLGAHARALVCTLVRRVRYCMYVDSYGFTCTPTAYRATRSRTCTSTTDTQTAGGAADGAVVCATDAAVAVAAVRPADATADGAVVRAALHTASSPCGQSMAQ